MACRLSADPREKDEKDEVESASADAKLHESPASLFEAYQHTSPQTPSPAMSADQYLTFASVLPFDFALCAA